MAASHFARAWGPSSLVFYPAVAAGCTVLLLACLAVRRGGGGAVSRALVYLGKVSYGLYVFHLLALNVADRLTSLLGWPWAVTLMVKFALGAGLTVLAAVLSYELFERHFPGLGLFALRDISARRRVIEYVGELITDEEADRRRAFPRPGGADLTQHRRRAGRGGNPL